MRVIIVNLVGLVMFVVGVVLLFNSGSDLSAFLFLGGLTLLASMPSFDTFFDYVIADKNEVLVRKRQYVNSFPLTFVSSILTLFKTSLKIPVFEERYIIKGADIEKVESATIAFLKEGEEAVATVEGTELVKISFKEYFRLWREQTKICKSGQVSKEIINKFYGDQSKGVKIVKRRLLLAIVFTLLSLSMMIGDPGAIYLTLIYTAVFLPMVILWIPDLIKAKAKQKAYEKANYFT